MDYSDILLKIKKTTNEYLEAANNRKFEKAELLSFRLNFLSQKLVNITKEMK